jgi:hypothetical protein
MRRNRVTQKDILFLSVSMFVMVTVWVGFSLYHTWATSTISEDLQMQIIPIDPNFDTATIHTLEERENINPLFERTAQPEVASESAIIISPTPVASPSAQPTTTPTVVPTAEPEAEPEPTGL